MHKMERAEENLGNNHCVEKEMSKIKLRKKCSEG
jgi:hypothetical protein